MCPKKRPKCLGNIFYKIGRFQQNLVRRFLNKFAAMWCKYFHLIWIMSLHYLVKLEKLIGHMLPSGLVSGRNSRILSTSTMAPKFARFESSWLVRVEVLQEKVYKIRITDLDELKQRLRTEWANWIMSLLWQPFVSGVVDSSSLQISVACFVHRLLQYFPHAVINWIQIWRIWRTQLRWDKFWSFFL